MDYRSALHILLQLLDYERTGTQSKTHIRYDLGRMEAFLAKMGNPHIGIPTIHIAGTKGKGSTAAMCANVLSSQGYRTGLFTSPHLHTFRERISLDGIAVSEQQFAALTQHVWPYVEMFKHDVEYGEVTLFETLTAMAFCHFKERADFQVLEVGLGGRLDTTNVCLPRVCGITSISLDHTSVLGDTIQLIAAEKAGIIKHGVPVITAPQLPEAMEVIESTCRATQSPLIKVGEHLTASIGVTGSQGQSFKLHSKLANYNLWTPLIGDYQIENAAIALGILENLKEDKLDISEQTLNRGFGSVSWPCRLEVLSQRPLVVCDGAHNPYSVARLRETLPKYLRYDRIIPIVGVSRDKNMEGIIEEIIPLFTYDRQPFAEHASRANQAQTIIVTSSRHPRSAATPVLEQAFHHQLLTESRLSTFNVQIVQAHGMEEALAMGLGKLSSNDLLLVTGSLFVAAEAREYFYGIEPELYPEFQSIHSVPQKF